MVVFDLAATFFLSKSFAFGILTTEGFPVGAGFSGALFSAGLAERAFCSAVGGLAGSGGFWLPSPVPIFPFLDQDFLAPGHCSAEWGPMHRLH